MSNAQTAISTESRGTLPVCVQCGGSLERVRRVGFLQERVLPLFNRFPWRCVLCHDITYRTARHRRELRRQNGVV